ncbi:MAG TPA: phosphoserine phosphatase SerB [Jatrophihabitans sp.]|jgi:phosphoserine phosphatase
MRPTSVLVTVTGRDRPGVTASFFAVLAAHDVDVRDVEQVVIRDRLILTVLVELRGDTASLRNSVTRAAGALGMDCELAVADDVARPAGSGVRIHVTILGHPLRAGAVGHVAQQIADAGGNIEAVTQLSTDPVTALELVVRTADPSAVQAGLVQAAEDTGVDIAVEPAGLRRKAKRLVVLDVDSTLIRGEAIDVLAERAGVAEEVRAITAAAMAGELDFADSLRERVALLAGLPASVLAEVRTALELTPGAATFVRTLRRLGYHVGVVSGGFTAVISRFVDELDLDFAAANELEIVDGVLTGRVSGPIVDAAGKAEALMRFAEKFDVPLSQTVAVGDGANDVAMLERAGLGIAFNAKAALRAAADAVVNVPYLDSVLFLLGVTRDEIAEAASP